MQHKKRVHLHDGWMSEQLMIFRSLCRYRTSVLKVIHEGSISVFYCDFGYYASLSIKQLITLDLEFMELPYQALKAKIASEYF